ncbi:hypothetical protein CN899_08145 [Bacillus thuringiensis]|uniref:Uncharacterized protein n=1 Tax=Bacillus thuringiensis TaxID=1428 RepID=A0A9X7C1U7_BACTU|nr:hypothetical protein [Bacillus thuringiensis]PGH85797.1 hypothetical protein CN899_08145 [Bacillus thuringiensis]
MLKFIKSAGYKVDSSGQKRKMAFVKCSICGAIKEARADNFKSYKSCGCLRRKKFDDLTAHDAP